MLRMRASTPTVQTGSRPRNRLNICQRRWPIISKAGDGDGLKERPWVGFATVGGIGHRRSSLGKNRPMQAARNYAGQELFRSGDR